MSADSVSVDVAVLGGGLAGCAAAIALARAGVAVTLLEREREPAHKVCGEFLSGEALTYLRQLGVDLPGLHAVPLENVRLAGPRTMTTCTLPFPAMSLTRRSLDACLLTLAQQAGVQVLRGSRAEHLAPSGSKWAVGLANQQELMAKDVFVATGKHDLHGWPRGPGVQPDLIGFKMYWQLTEEQYRALGTAVELISYPGGYAGLQPVEGNRANLCCLVQRSTLQTFGDGWAGLLRHMLSRSKHLRMRLAGATPLLTKPLTIAPLPYGFVRQQSDGLWYLGDQAVVIPSFTGDGMSLALHTGMLAAQHYLQQTSANAYQQALATQVAPQVALATVISKTLVRHPGIALLCASIWPGALRFMAKRTRIRAAHLVLAADSACSATE